MVGGQDPIRVAARVVERTRAKMLAVWELGIKAHSVACLRMGTYTRECPEKIEVECVKGLSNSDQSDWNQLKKVSNSH